MTWHKEHMTGTEVLKVQTSSEAFGGQIGTDGDPRGILSRNRVTFVGL